MIKRALFIVAATAGCSINIEKYLNNCASSVPCTCSAGLHGVQPCINGSATATCECTAPTTPQIQIQGNPQALSASATYTATVAGTAGLIHNWTISGGSLSTTPTADAVTFMTGAIGSLVLTVDTVNTGGDSAPPISATFPVVAPPPALAIGDVLVGSPLTAGRVGVSASIVTTQPGITYSWRIVGDSTLASTLGPVVKMNIGTTNFTLYVSAVNGAGAAATELPIPIVVVPPQVEILAGTVGGPGHLAGAPGANRFNQPAGLAGITSGAPLYVVEQALSAVPNIGQIVDGEMLPPLVRAVQADGTASTVAALPLFSTDGSDLQASAPGPVLMVTQGAGAPYLLIGDTADGSTGQCQLYQVSLGATPSVAPFSATTSQCGACVNDLTDPKSAIVALTQASDGTIYGSDGNAIFTLDPSGGDATLVAGSDDCQGIGNFPSDILALAPAPGGLLVLSADAIRFLATSGGTPQTVYDNSVVNVDDNNGLVALTPDGDGNYFVATARQIFTLPSADFASASFASLTSIAGSDAQPSTNLPPLPAKDGDDTDANFVTINGAYFAAGVLYVTDDNLVRTVQPDPLKPGSYAVATLSGVENHVGDADKTVNDPPTAAAFNTLHDVVVNAQDSVFMVDSSNPNSPLEQDPTQNCKVKRFSNGQVKTIAGNGCSYVEASGRALSSPLGQPQGLALDHNGNLFYGDVWNYVVKEISASGLLLTEAGAVQSIKPADVGDGFVATAVFVNPHGMAFNSDESILAVADYFGYVRLILNGQVVTPIANATCIGDDPSCPINITGIAFDLADNIILNDTEKGVLQLSVPDYQGFPIVSNQTCTQPPPPVPGSEPCATACLSGRASGIAIEPTTGDIFVGEGELIRRVHHDGTSCTVTTVAGIPGALGVRQGTLSQATFNQITSLAISPLTGDLYVTDGAEGVLLRVRY